MSIEDYLKAKNNSYDNREENEKVIQYNKELIEDYPFLAVHNRWTDKVPDDYDYSFTELDDLEDGWRIAFGEDLLKDLKEELIKSNLIDKYRITQIKEKFGSLRWYSFNSPTEWEYNILPKYEALSAKTCGKCGKSAEWVGQDWIYPWCDKCAKDMYDRESKFYKNTKFEDLFERITEVD